MEGDVTRAQAEEAVKTLLRFFHVPNTDSIYEETPKRYVNALYEIIGGHDVPAPRLRTFESKSLGEIVFMGPLRGTSMCPHHLFPYLIQAYFAYMPSDKAVGISKPGRLLQWVCSRAGLQEEMGNMFLDEFDRQVPNAGTMVLLKGWHLCTSVRGTKQSESETITMESRGNFKTQMLQGRFLNLIRLAKGEE